MCFFLERLETLFQNSIMCLGADKIWEELEITFNKNKKTMTNRCVK